MFRKMRGISSEPEGLCSMDRVSGYYCTLHTACRIHHPIHWVNELSTQFHLESRLNASGAKLLLLLYSAVESGGITLRLYCA